MGKFVSLSLLSSQNSSKDITDVLTSKSSTLMYDADTMQKMLALVKNAESMLEYYECDTCD